MKTTLLTFLTATVLSISALACPGGNLLQVIVKEKGVGDVVVAAYNKPTGDLVASNKSYVIVNIKALTEVPGSKIPKSVIACTSPACNKLIDMENATLEVTIAKHNFATGKTKTIVKKIKNVSTGPNAPLAKGGVPRNMKPLNPLEPIQCATK